MGNWNLSIHGVGPHDNLIAQDVEQIARRVVAELKAAGHAISHAFVTTGGLHVIEHNPANIQTVVLPPAESFGAPLVQLVGPLVGPAGSGETGEKPVDGGGS